jgi:hypothetical protein
MVLDHVIIAVQLVSRNGLERMVVSRPGPCKQQICVVPYQNEVSVDTMPNGDGWSLVCAVPSPKSPFVSRQREHS